MGYLKIWSRVCKAVFFEHHEKGDHILNKKGTIAKDVVKEPVVEYPATPKSKRLTISSLAGQE